MAHCPQVNLPMHSNAGTVPFKDPSIMGLYDVIRTQPITFPHKRAVSAGLKDLISRMLCKDPCQRITLPQVMTHRWTTHNSSMPLQCRQVFAQLHDGLCSVAYSLSCMHAFTALQLIVLTEGVLPHSDFVAE